MIATKVRLKEVEISPEETKLYIIQMLDELSVLALSSGLKEVASLLRATSAASRIDVNSEIET